MNEQPVPSAFEPINRAYKDVFRPGRLSIGLVAPLESYMSSAVPTMNDHIERVQLAEALGFSAVWLRDVPFNVPTFGDAGQVFDPFVYLGLLAGVTSRIALGVASIILPLRHPAHVAKAAASVDSLSGGRLLLGVASGDRPEEYPAMSVPYAERGSRFRASMEYIETVWSGDAVNNNVFGETHAAWELLPPPHAGRVPLLITGGSQQSADWIAGHGDGWMVYPRDTASQGTVVRAWRERIEAQGLPDKPVVQPLYVDLQPEANAPPRPLHLGFASGAAFLNDYLRSLETIGINHVALNLRFNQRDMETTLKQLAAVVLPEFGQTAERA